PLVYHLFGHISVANSLVFSEDRYFDYLIGMTLNKSLIPSAVRAALSSTSLLFLGFQMDDWEFRVFFRFLMAQEGREMLKFFSHAAAQIEPEEDRIIDVKRARRYLEEYFESENIEIYWGSTKEFLGSLWQHL
ncbi:MAG: SIR2 family protein, partial [Anaerolineales bacterium]|nr:SIR2 family protein [Anaerolineales bacterium]